MLRPYSACPGIIRPFFVQLSFRRLELIGTSCIIPFEHMVLALQYGLRYVHPLRCRVSHGNIIRDIHYRDDKRKNGTHGGHGYRDEFSSKYFQHYASPFSRE